MFGIEARLPVDVCFGTQPDEKGEHLLLCRQVERGPAGSSQGGFRSLQQSAHVQHKGI